MSGNTGRRQKLFNKQRGKCYWCGKQMRMGEVRDGGRAPHDLCTIDHVHPRWSPQRKPGEAAPVVGACFQCNNARSRIDNWTFGIAKKPMPNWLESWAKRNDKGAPNGR